MKTIITPAWADYELLQTGDGRRLERFGKHLVSRPETSVLWNVSDPRPEWHETDAVFEGGEWVRDRVSEDWTVTYEGVTLRLRPTPFRHVGIFPEQAANWSWLRQKVAEIVAKGRKPRVLNLFAYTGGASIAAALSGAEVTHVDASKGSVFWASENARLSGLSEKAIRWIVDDVPKFIAREVRRGATYDIILLDPPTFGRGSKGEIWRLADHLPALLEDVGALMPEPKGLLLNFYATELYPESVLRLAQEHISGLDLELATLSLAENDGKSLLQTGYLVRS
jgi:23S rRNA (cytosine1962-C5)-methyltransferase